MVDIRVRSVHWLLIAACITCIAVYVSAQTEDVDRRAEEASGLLGALFGFKPCMDDSCRSYESSTPESVQSELDKDYEAQEYEPQDPETDASNSNENPRIHCIILRPSAVKTFGEIERMHPGLSDIKYKVLEELIDHMYTFATLKLENCDSPMKLVDLVILAGNSLKTQYVLAGGENCSYRMSTSRTGLSTPMPLDPLYPAQGHEVSQTPCPAEQTSEQSHLPATEAPCSEPIPEYPQEIQTLDKPCTEGVDLQPCEDGLNVEIDGSVEIIDEEEHLSPPFVGSIRGSPGVHYPNYTEIPISSFTCADKYVPGFYADLETGCQVFHVCYEHRRESFLCPLGTIFNQPILACDYWYSSNCSLATSYYKVNERTHVEVNIHDAVDELVSVTTSHHTEETAPYEPDEDDLDTIAQFLPVKAKVVVTKPLQEAVSIPEPEVADVDQVASDIFDNIMITATKATSKTRDIVRSIPEPSVKEYKPIAPQVVQDFKTEPMRLKDVLAQSISPVPKAKLATAISISKAKASIPVIAKAKLAVPAMKVAASAKLAAAVPVVVAKAAVPVLASKAKIAAASAKLAATVPVIAAKAAVPVLATKAKVAAAVPVAKVAAVATKAKMAAVPVLATKAKLAAAVPVAKVAAVATKAKVAAVPVLATKAKLAAAVPVAKVAAVKAAVPVAAKGKVAAAAIPALKTKMLASAVPLAKAKVFSPVLKGKVIAGGKAPILKAKMLALPLAKTKLAGSIPLAKVKLAKAAAISPLTKKALAVGYMKLLKAKKLALVG